jgi:hypothetical protein
MKKNRPFSVCILVLMSFFIFPANSWAQESSPDFLHMKGTLLTHQFADKEDSLSAREIIELRNEKGLPVWFGREIQKVVCLTGVCRMIHLWLFWDCAGNFLGVQILEKEPLTKTDHNEFKIEDYRKLNLILSDSTSVLKNLKQEELIIIPEKKSGLIDASSGATQPFLQDYLVKNAAFTCYCLWHTVYGNTLTEIHQIISQRIDEAYLKLLFDQTDIRYNIQAIGFLRKHPAYSQFSSEIINKIKSKDENLSWRALSYFDKDRLESEKIQKELVLIFDEMAPQRQSEFIWKLADIGKVNDEVILVMLQKFEEQQISTSLIGYVYRLIKTDNLANPAITAKLKSFLAHENLYVRNITERLLSGQ